MELIFLNSELNLKIKKLRELPTTPSPIKTNGRNNPIILFKSLYIFIFYFCFLSRLNCYLLPFRLLYFFYFANEILCLVKFIFKPAKFLSCEIEFEDLKIREQMFLLLHYYFNFVLQFFVINWSSRTCLARFTEISETCSNLVETVLHYLFFLAPVKTKLFLNFNLLISWRFYLNEINQTSVCEREENLMISCSNHRHTFENIIFFYFSVSWTDGLCFILIYEINFQWKET